MGEMKSAFEKAMEKVEKLEKASPEELLRTKGLTAGNSHAAKFMSDPDYHLKDEMVGYSPELMMYVCEGVEETLLRNITLPQNQKAGQTNKRAMQGLSAIKKDKSKLKSIFSKIDQLCDYYDKARHHNYSELKRFFQSRIEGMQKGMEARSNIGAEIEAHPQFQEEWRKVLNELNTQYGQVLSDHKEEIRSLPWIQ
ncbi:MAG: hypothetical protein SVY53_02550 [Chloroflexota bacterium]|nr:hypothetical protein [Chloroflexota bacterium]